jgi:alpha-tubulin suppressor-like RCC1 family protein
MLKSHLSAVAVLAWGCLGAGCAPSGDGEPSDASMAADGAHDAAWNLDGGPLDASATDGQVGEAGEAWPDAAAPDGESWDADADWAWKPSEMHVAAGDNFTCAIGKDRALRCWGEGRHARRGDGTSFHGRIAPGPPTGVHEGGEPWTDWTVVTAGIKHACGLRADGTAWCWGNAHGAGTWSPSDLRPTPVRGAAAEGEGPIWDDWKSLAAGRDHTCGLRADGTLWCWGWDYWGQLGDGRTDGVYHTTPVQVLASEESGDPPWDDWVAVAAGGARTWSQPGGTRISVFSCGIRAGGTLWCWGGGDDGQRGDGTSGLRATPSQVLAADAEAGGDAWDDWVHVAVGGHHACGVRSDGSAWCWGLGNDGQRGDASDTEARFTPARVLAAGAAPGGPAWTDWQLLVAGDAHTCGVRADGTGWCWGQGDEGQRGDDTTEGPQFTPSPIAAAEPLRAWTWLAAGATHTCGLHADGSLWCWGSGGYGQRGDGTGDAIRAAPVEVDEPLPFEPPWTDWVQFAVGWDATCGLRTDGSLWCWGSARHGRLGSIYRRWNDYRTTPAPVLAAGEAHGSARWTDWVAVSRNDRGFCGIRSDGSLWCWGYGANGTLGNGTTEDSWTPSRVLASGEPAGGGAWSDWTAVSGACGLRADHSIWCWSGQTSGTAHLTPQQVPGSAGHEWVEISSGQMHGCARRSDNTLWCWGDNSFGQLGNGDVAPCDEICQVVTPEEEPSDVAWSDWVAVRTSGNRANPDWESGHTCGLRSDGSLWCWGNGDGAYPVDHCLSSPIPCGHPAGGQRGDGTILRVRSTPIQVLAADEPPGGAVWSDWTQVSLGYAHTSGMRADGTLWWWGGVWDLQSSIRQSQTTPTQAPLQELDGGATGDDWVQLGSECGLRADGSLWCWHPNPRGDAQSDRSFRTGGFIQVVASDLGEL